MIVTRPALIRPFTLSLLVVSALSSKALHLAQHAASIPPTRLILYFPTLFMQETLLFVCAWFLLHKTTGVKSIFGAAVTATLTILTFILSSSQIGFYFVTGSEIRWDAATSVGSDPGGRKLMRSGLRSFLGAAGVLLFISWLCTPGICMLLSKWLYPLFEASSAPTLDEELPSFNLQQTLRGERLIRSWTACATLVTVTLSLIRPHVPYSHTSEALPFSFFQALWSKPAERRQAGDGAFPFPELLGEEYWEAPNGHFKGWAPGMGHLNTAAYTAPAWATEPWPPGFQRWFELSKLDDEGDLVQDAGETEGKSTRRKFYSPADDPLRITNLNHELLEPLSRALETHEIPVTHVVLVMMESARKDVFPFKSGSHLHQEILLPYRNQDSQVIQEVNAKLSRITPVAEKLTGESSGFLPHRNQSESAWNDTAGPGMGGINIHGVLTGSSLSFKSAVMNHCGVGPLPVNFMDEVRAEIYQPCIMQILELFNRLKRSNLENDTSHHKPGNGIERIHGRRWTSVFLQSITGWYDGQHHLNDMMGFEKTIYRENIAHKGAKHHHENMEEVNYFGFAEHEVYPYLQDVVSDAIKKNERLFLSHFTSTTHHPWSTPADFRDEQYFAEDSLMAKHEDTNKYLNTVRYVDSWLGNMLKVLDDTGIANETLVVFVGDHGQAFHEDAPVSGTYENGHISNFRIPLLFRHPLLPRMQITANATSMSVVPTILDLLVSTGSLNQIDSTAALDLMNEYEGQSLIRPYQMTHQGRQAWNFGVINAGGTMLSVGSAAVPYRLILPLTEDFEYVFSNTETDPDELHPLRAWSSEALSSRVRREHGDKAGEWVADAEKVGRWWVEERQKLWNYHGDR